MDEYFDFLSEMDIRIKGHRIGIESILYHYLYDEENAEEIAKRFPSITLEQVYATILFYFRNKEKMEKYLNDWLEYGESMREKQEQNPPAVLLKVRKLMLEQKQHNQRSA